MKAKAKTAAPTRRLGVESSETRMRLIEAAAQIVEEEGYAAVTARRLAEEVGLKREIVHYYFRTIEDLLIAVIRRDGETVRLALAEALESTEPLRALWDLSRKTSATMFEFIALASRREAVQIEVKRYLEEFRRTQTQALARHMELRGIQSTVPPVAVIIALQSVIQSLAIESTLGVSDGHAEIAATVDQYLRAFEKRGELPASGSRIRSRRRAR